MRWIEYLSQFDYDIQYIKGTSNKVADSLSRYYQSDTDEDNHLLYDYVTVDALHNPEGEDLPWIRMIEVRAIDLREQERLEKEEEEQLARKAEEAKLEGVRRQEE